MIGDISGCLEIIDEYSKDIQVEAEHIFRNYAQTEWEKRLDKSCIFGSNQIKYYYNLSQQEINLFEQKETMPDSFIPHFVHSHNLNQFILQNNDFLWHKKNPNTFNSLLIAIKESNLIKVKCSICGRSFITDYRSFQCIKWRNCIGSECLKKGVDSNVVDYSNNLYHWTSDQNSELNNQLQLCKIEELSLPLTYYSLPQNSAPSLKFAYISDIHLDHHLKYYNNSENYMITQIARKLYMQIEHQNIDFIIFGGDTSSSAKLAIKFYRYFMHLYDLKYYKSFRKDINQMHYCKKELNIIIPSINSNSTNNNTYELHMEKRIHNLTAYINYLIKKLSINFEFTKLLRYKSHYHSDDSLNAAYDFYKQTPTYKQLNLSPKIESAITEIIRLQNIVNDYSENLSLYKNNHINNLKTTIQKFENKLSKSLNAISINDYKHHYLNNVYVILGNHEYIDFTDIKSGTSYYEKELSSVGIHLLHNSYIIGKNYLIYGGTGFAKYDPKWNAQTLICCKNFTRELECEETDKFERNYKEALNYAKNNKLCFICISHYPVTSCLNNYAKEAIYFTGHTHHNEIIKNTEQTIFADNQIGYTNPNIAFKYATTGLYINPYANLNDGLFLTTLADYLNFYRYIGENIGDGNLLYQRCRNKKSNLYVIKRHGYYGFFIICYSGSTKGISIVNGGKTKKITGSTDINWICENFEIVLSKYIQLLLPLRNIQTQLSKELKFLGLSGKIHGCIVDIDFYHHIMVNPIDGTIEFYYSSQYGLIQNLNTFEDVINSLETHQAEYFDQYNIPELRKNYLKNVKSSIYILSMSSHKILDAPYAIPPQTSQQEYIISRTDGAYGVSRKVTPLQRLFDTHVLRDFDIRLTNTVQKKYRTYLYNNRKFFYEYEPYIIIEDTGTDLIKAKKITNWSKSDNKNYKPTLSKDFQLFSITDLKRAMLNDSGSSWIK